MNQVDFPLDIVEELLKLLPVKSIIRFKNVCRSWNSLISDPKFKKRLLSIQSSPRILISSLSGSRSLDCEKGSIRRLSIPPPFKIVGSRNGLVCVALDKCQNFIVWNPTTDTYSWNLPNPELIPIDDSFIYGFGYDSSTDDYKIVVIANCGVSLNIPKFAIEVFSLRKNSWKAIPEIADCYAAVFMKPTLDYQAGVTCNGALHWPILNRHISLGDLSIIGFDLQNEEAIALTTPFIYGLFNIGIIKMAVIDECLCLSFQSTWGGVQLWAMKEYGEVNSWQKLIFIPSAFPNYFKTMYTYCFELLPLYKTASGEILLLEGGKELIRVCCKDNTVEKLEFDIEHGSVDHGLSEATVYVESLESPLDYT